MGGRKAVRSFIQSATLQKFRARVAPQVHEAPCVVAGARLQSSDEILAGRKEVEPTKFRPRAIQSEKKHTRNQRYYENLVSDIDNPDSESAKGRKTRFMAAIQNPNVRQYLQQKLEKSQRYNLWYQQKQQHQQHQQQRQQQGASQGSWISSSASSSNQSSWWASDWQQSWHKTEWQK